MLGFVIFLAITIVVFIMRMFILSAMKDRYEMNSTISYYKDVFLHAGRRLKKISAKKHEQSGRK